MLASTSLCQAGWLSEPFKEVNKPINKAGNWVSKQAGVVKEQIKAQQDPAKIRETANAAVDAANDTTQKALSEQKALIDAANAKLETREKIFSASMVGLFVSNGLTIYGLFAGRRRSKVELRGLELENEKKELELQELKKRLDDAPPKST